MKRKTLQHRNIFGKRVNVFEAYTNKDHPDVKNVAQALDKLFEGGNGVNKVTVLPDISEAEEGGIYYDTTNSTYYLVGNSGYIPITDPRLKIIDDVTDSRHYGEGVSGPTLEVGGYDLLPNTYYVFGALPLDGNNISYLSLHFLNIVEGMYNQYLGRFSVSNSSTDVNITLNDGVHFPDDIIDLEAGHTYEFNVLGDTCLITDITYTEPEVDDGGV